MMLLESDQIQALSALARQMLPASARTGTSDPTAPESGIMATESLLVMRAVDKRRREFAAGRRAARDAMRALGHAPQPVLAGIDRAPIWPRGLTGSISHCDHACIAVLAPTREIRVIGVDIEEDKGLMRGLEPLICTAEERAWLADMPAAHRARLAKLIFSAKESVYKCQYPLSGKMLSFHDMSITLSDGFGCFEAEFRTDAAPFSAGDRLSGQFLRGHGMILTSVSLPA